MAAALTRPFMVHISNSAGSGDLADLWEYGVDGVVIDVNSAQTETINGFRQTIDQLGLEGRRRKIRLMPIIPGSSASAAQTEGPAPDEDEEFPDI